MNRIGVYLKEISLTSFIQLPRRPGHGSAGDLSHNSTKKSNPSDDNESNAALTSHIERLFSIYLEHNTQNVQSYKKYLEKCGPHRQLVIEQIYKNGMFIASSVCEIVTLISSRYLTKTDDENAQLLKKVVTEAILNSFDPTKKL